MNQSNLTHGTKGPDSTTALPCGIPSNFPAPIILADDEGKIAYVTNRFAALMQQNAEDVVGQNLADLLPQATASSTSKRLLSKDATIDMPFELALPDDARRSVTGSTEKWVEPDGTLYRAIHVADVTPFQQEEARLKSELFRLKSCLESTNAGTWELHVPTGEVRINARWADMLGYSLQELEPIKIDTWRALVNDADLPTVEKALDLYLSGEADIYEAEFRMHHKDGYDLWIRTKGSVFVWSDDGKPEWIFGTHFLIDSERKSRDDQRRSLAMLDRMAKVAGVGGWEVNIKTGQVLWSDETKRIHGVGPDYVPTVEEGISFYAPEARPTITAAVEEGMISGKPWDLELPFIRLNGEQIWVRAMGEVEFDGDDPVRIVGAFQDITDRVQVRNELVAAKEWTSLAAAKGRVGLWSLDAVLGQLVWDEQMSSLFGKAAADTPDSMAQWLLALPIKAQGQLKAAVRKSLFAGEDLELELSFKTPDGAPKVAKLVGAPHFGTDGVIDRLQGACFDLTEHRQIMARYEEEAAKLSVTLTAIGDGVITTDETGRITWMNPEAERLSGWTLADAQNKASSTILQLKNQSTGKVVPNPIEQCIQERQTVFLEADATLTRKDGMTIAVDDSASPLLDTDKRVMGAVLVFRDTTKQRDLSRSIEYRASHDTLTGLLNRGKFLEKLETCIATPIQRNGSYLFAIDLDHFKRINDSLGHEAGDMVLKRLADILRECAGEEAAIARIGGDEFALCLRAKDAKCALAIGVKICERVADGAVLRRVGDATFRTGASVGIVALGDIDIAATEALRYADIAAYTAKNRGRGQACMWSTDDSSMQAMSRQTSMIKLIEQAISAGSWHVQEQCIQDMESLDDGDTFVELLIRLTDDNGDMVAPSEFLPAAERYGLMQPIDLWMCQYALDYIEKDVAAGQQKTVSVNISPSSLHAKGFQQDLIGIIAAIDEKIRARLCVEVTETAILQDYENAKEFLTALRSYSVQVAIDDFGAGHTSFRHFRNIPADFLKIDGSFIERMDNPIDVASIECFIRMAEVANLKTIAEHVESHDQIQALRALNVDYVQGFLLGRPR